MSRKATITAMKKYHETISILGLLAHTFDTTNSQVDLEPYAKYIHNSIKSPHENQFSIKYNLSTLLAAATTITTCHNSHPHSMVVFRYGNPGNTKNISHQLKPFFFRMFERRSPHTAINGKEHEI
jgi:hypothetical protein